MVKHIVTWSFKEEISEADKPALLAGMQSNLEGLVGEVPGLLRAKFYKEILGSSTHEMAFVADLEGPEELAGYNLHPAHVKVADTYVRPFVGARSCLDYVE